MPHASILIVEPNPGILVVARNVLARAGWSVVAVSHPKEGAQLATERPFNLAILEAAKSHLEVAEALGRRPEGPIPIVFTVVRGSARRLPYAPRAVPARVSRRMARQAVRRRNGFFRRSLGSSRALRPSTGCRRYGSTRSPNRRRRTRFLSPTCYRTRSTPFSSRSRATEQGLPIASRRIFTRPSRVPRCI